MQVIKRDGTKVPFDEEKIASAVAKAFEATGEVYAKDEEAKKIETRRQSQDIAIRAKRILLGNKDTDGIAVERIQDLVERLLMDGRHFATAKAYILYRASHDMARNSLMQKFNEITNTKSTSSDLKRSNANINGDTPMGIMLQYGTEASKYYYEKYLLPPDIARAHSTGDIHIHDFDFYALTTTCCQIELSSLLKNGFSTGHGYLREPQDISSYAALACIAIQSNQNDQHGGQAIVDFDRGLAAGVKKTFRKAFFKNLKRAIAVGHALTLENPPVELSEYCIDESVEAIPMDFSDSYYKEMGTILDSQCDGDDYGLFVKLAFDNAMEDTKRTTYQAMEALIHNLNTMHSRAGAQTPFSSINYGTDTSIEGRMVIKAILDATDAGLGGGETPIFPVQIFRVKDGVNFKAGDPNYDLFQLACRVSGKRLFPNFSFIDAPFNLQYYKAGHPETEIAYMGCRTRVMGNVYDKSREIAPRRGNLSFTSINLPRLAIEAKKDEGAFYKSLDSMMDLVVRQLLERFKIQCRKHVYNYPFLMGQGVWLDSEKLGYNDTVGEVLKHGTLSIGFIGLAETLVALYGHHHGEGDEWQNKGLAIIRHMRERLDRESHDRGLNFTLLATPAEGLSGRFIKIDRERYGVMPGVTDREYYTNSFHIPVYYPISITRKIDLEAPYHALCNAGHITYIELNGDMAKNPKAFEQIVRYMGKAGIGYGAINHPVDRDPVCGYVGVIGDVCPRCGRREGEAISPERLKELQGKGILPKTVGYF